MLNAKKADKFYSGSAWRRLRASALKRDGYCCMRCGFVDLTGKDMQVDHVLERRDYPQLQYVIENLQTLCRRCHTAKTFKLTHLKDKPQIGSDGFPIGRGWN